MDIRENIVEEYEKIFGVTSYEVLFSSDDAEYNELCKMILNSDINYYDKNKLPFSEIHSTFCKKNKYANNILNINVDGNSPLFYIKMEGVCNACGYYSIETNYFYIKAGSLIALHEDGAYMNTPSSIARKRLLDSVCVVDGNFYKLKRDAKCKSATAAACYVLGKAVTYSKWRDLKGKYLKDFYPNNFIVGE